MQGNLSMTPLRTALFVPGNRPERMGKAIESGSDAVIIDLEDAVPYSEKEKARLQVNEFLGKNIPKKIYVRVNGLNTPFCEEDIESVINENLAGIMLPKVESKEDIFKLDKFLTNSERNAGLEIGTIEIISICESAKGLEELYSIVSAEPEHHRVSIVVFGAADFTLDLGISLTHEGKELEYPRRRIPVACRAAGIVPPLDSPWMIDLKDFDGLIEDAKKAKAYGFQGKIVIHPSQIKYCHDVFTPSEKEIAYAKMVIEAFEDAEREGKAAIQIDGKFIDYAIVEKSKRTCALAKLLLDKVE